MKTRPVKTNPVLANQNDEDLVSSAKMVVKELAEIRAELVRRKITVDLLTYSDGDITAEIYRETRVTL